MVLVVSGRLSRGLVGWLELSKPGRILGWLGPSQFAESLRKPDGGAADLPVNWGAVFARDANFGHVEVGRRKVGVYFVFSGRPTDRECYVLIVSRDVMRRLR
jgi:hypothetical protein